MSRAFVDEREAEAVAEAVRSGFLQGGGPHLERVEAALQERLGVRFAVMTTSGTDALEICLAAHGVGAGDEVIVPTLTHTSTANAPLRQGARVVFADSMPDSPHVDPVDVERRITECTRAVITVHYGGVPRGVDELKELCASRGLLLIEDAAQAFDSRHRGRCCGTLADGGCISFHETKNVCCGEGGVLLTDDAELARQARTIREMGTDRSLFRQGEVSRYTWRMIGSSTIPSDVLMALLEVQLSKADEILSRRRRVFDRYQVLLEEAEEQGLLRRTVVPEGAEPNGHILHVLLADAETRDRCRARLNGRGIGAAPHFHPLHATPFGQQLGTWSPESFPHAVRLGDALLRLPLSPYLREEEQDRVVRCLLEALGADDGAPAS